MANATRGLDLRLQLIDRPFTVTENMHVWISGTLLSQQGQRPQDRTIRVHCDSRWARRHNLLEISIHFVEESKDNFRYSRILVSSLSVGDITYSQ